MQGFTPKKFVSPSVNSTWLLVGSGELRSRRSLADPGSFHLVDLPSPWAVESSAFSQQEKEGQAPPAS